MTEHQPDAESATYRQARHARRADRGTLCLAFDNAVAERAYFLLAQLGRRVLQHKLIPAEDVAETASNLASTAVPDDYHMAVKECWNLAADAYDRAGDEEALVLQQAKDFPLSNLFATSYADHEGREVARGPSRCVALDRVIR